MIVWCLAFVIFFHPPSGTKHQKALSSSAHRGVLFFHVRVVLVVLLLQVVSIVPYGAFVNIDGNIDGLVHISEMAVGRVDSVEDVLQMGQEVQVRVSEVNTDNNTVNLSMVPAGAYEQRRSGGEYGEERLLFLTRT